MPVPVPVGPPGPYDGPCTSHSHGPCDGLSICLSDAYSGRVNYISLAYAHGDALYTNPDHGEVESWDHQCHYYHTDGEAGPWDYQCHYYLTYGEVGPWNY